MKNNSNGILGIIPARGGSKSIPLKNLATLNGQPLISYVINAGKRCKAIDRLVCSTDNEKIAAVAAGLGVEVMKRAENLSQDDSHVDDVITDIIRNLEKSEGYTPFAVALLQPTSPFVLPGHIDRCIELLKENPTAGSAQTIAKMPHNYHAFNQRVFDDGIVSFRFAEERAVCYNKQTKPKFYAFGNFIITRTSALLENKGVFAAPSLGHEVHPYYALDVDGPDDLELAEWYIHKGKVILP